MINPKLIFLLLFGTAILAWACQPKTTPDTEAGAIVEAVNSGNLDKARNRADKFMASGAELDTMSISRLCSLAIAMTKLSESGEHADDYAARALQCYRAAMARDSISATGFFNAMPQDEYKYVNMLRQLLGPITARENGVVYSVNEMGEDEMLLPGDTTNIHASHE